MFPSYYIPMTFWRDLLLLTHCPQQQNWRSGALRATLSRALTLDAVLLPGLDGTGDLFEPFVSAAPRGINTVVVSYPTSEASLDSLERIAREALTGRCIVIAESFSGPIGVRVAADPRVQALVLCNSFVRSPHSPGVGHLAITPLFSISIPLFALRVALLGRKAKPDIVERTQKTIRRVPPEVIAQRVKQTLKTDEQAAIRSLAKPVLYLRGASDRLVSEASWREIQEVRPDAQMARIEGPHLLLQVSPRECWDAILSFVGETMS
jgi:pimeloyl-ACP methyl ester carboxylesterase